MSILLVSSTIQHPEFQYPGFDTFSGERARCGRQRIRWHRRTRTCPRAPPYLTETKIDEYLRRVHGNRRDALDTEEGVVLGNTLRAGGRTSLDLAGLEGNDEVGDDGVLSLTRAVGHHDTPAVGLSELRTVRSMDRKEKGHEFSAASHIGTRIQLTPGSTQRSYRSG